MAGIGDLVARCGLVAGIGHEALWKLVWGALAPVSPLSISSYCMQGPLLSLITSALSEATPEKVLECPPPDMPLLGYPPPRAVA